MNIIQIIGKHSPLLAATLEHNKVVEINPENVKTAINELLKAVLEKYTNRIVENVYGNTFDHDLYVRDYFGTENSVDINMSEGSPLQYGCSVKIDKESITSQLPKFLKEIGI